MSPQGGARRNPIGEINFSQGAPKPRCAETNRSKSRKTPEVSRGCKSRKQMVGLTPLRELTRMCWGRLGEAAATTLTYHQGAKALGASNEPKQSSETSWGLLTTRSAWASGATKTSTKTNREARLRKIEQGEALLGILNYPRRRRSPVIQLTKRSKSTNPPDIFQRHESRTRLTRPKPLRAPSKMRVCVRRGKEKPLRRN